MYIYIYIYTKLYETDTDFPIPIRTRRFLQFHLTIMSKSGSVGCGNAVKGSSRKELDLGSSPRGHTLHKKV